MDTTNNYQQTPLEKLRTRLLDLSARNRLLNYPHNRTSNLRIIDEIPDQLYTLLLSEEELRFLSIPEPTRDQLIDAGYLQIDKQTGQEVPIKPHPTVEEWPRWLGFHTSYELPELQSNSTPPDKHHDKAIQTLLFPYELETRLRGLRSKAETAIEETGANILYLTFGFLEWFESPASDASRHAPLLLVPVRLAKGRLNRQTGPMNTPLPILEKTSCPICPCAKSCVSILAWRCLISMTVRCPNNISPQCSS